MKTKITWPKSPKIKYLIGIDEAGRGPLAGPVAVAVVSLKKPLSPKFLRGLKDSKGLSEAKRLEWLAKLKKLKQSGQLNYAVSLVGATIIDRRGIVSAIRLATRRSLRKLELNPKYCQVLLDGSLKCDEEYLNQKTIIRGDQTEPLIALASIVAKVRRDNLMKRLALKYPKYQFEIHKGYGTKLHRQKIKKHGLSLIHRRSFLSKLLKNVTTR